MRMVLGLAKPRNCIMLRARTKDASAVTWGDEMTASETASIAAPPRLVTLDALRGFAVMGILAMNIVAFAMPDLAYITPLASTPQAASDAATWFAAFVLVDGKMRGLFSLLFGASMLLIADQAARKGESPAKVHYRRMIWLALFGLAHFFFIWFGDILFLYAVVGSIAFLARGWEARRLIKWGLSVYALGMLLTAAFFGSLLFLEIAASAPGAPAEVTSAYRQMMADPSMATDGAKYLAVYQGDYTGILNFRFGMWSAPIILVAQSIGETLPLMWLGMALYKNGFLTGAWDSGDYRRWAVRLVPAGLALMILIGLLVQANGYGVIVSLNALFGWSMIPRLMLTIGYAALLVLAIRAMAGSALLDRVAAAGQAAFTNYLGTSIILTTIFYGYGLGLFGTVERVHLFLFVIGMWALMLLWSQPWLARFRYGPLEWLWRSLARGAVQPMRR